MSGLVYLHKAKDLIVGGGRRLDEMCKPWQFYTVRRFNVFEDGRWAAHSLLIADVPESCQETHISEHFRFMN